MTLLRTLIKQLFLLQRIPEGAVHDLVECHRKAPRGPHEHFLTDLLFQIISRLDHLFIVIDGLDECDEPNQRSVCAFLCHLVALPHAKQVKVLVTCRNEERPLKWLHQFQRLHILPRKNVGDIHAFVRAEIESRIASRQLTLRNHDLADSIVKVLSDKAEGMLVITRLLSSHASLIFLGFFGSTFRSETSAKQRRKITYDKYSLTSREV